jgi:hypothetical protein
MWHPDILDQQLEKIVERVIICQKIVRGFLCRRRLLHLLSSIQQQTIDKIEFVNQIDQQGSIAFNKMNLLNNKIKVYKFISIYQ